MSIKIDRSKRDVYPNAPAFASENFEIDRWYIERMTEGSKSSFNAFQEKLKTDIPNPRSLPTMYRIAFRQHIEDLAHIIGDIESKSGKRITGVEDNTLRDDDKKYIGDLLARITKRVFNVTNDKSKTIEILKPLESFSRLFNETVEKMVNEVIDEGYPTEVDQIMQDWKAR